MRVCCAASCRRQSADDVPLACSVYRLVLLRVAFLVSLRVVRFCGHLVAMPMHPSCMCVSSTRRRRVRLPTASWPLGSQLTALECFVTAVGQISCVKYFISSSGHSTPSSIIQRLANRTPCRPHNKQRVQQLVKWRRAESCPMSRSDSRKSFLCSYTSATHVQLYSASFVGTNVDGRYSRIRAPANLRCTAPPP